MAMLCQPHCSKVMAQPIQFAELEELTAAALISVRSPHEMVQRDKLNREA